MNIRHDGGGKPEPADVGSEPSEVHLRLVVSVAVAAEMLGISDDLVYELIEREQLPCLRLGRRRLIPRRAIELLVESAMSGFCLRSFCLCWRARHRCQGISAALIGSATTTDMAIGAVRSCGSAALVAHGGTARYAAVSRSCSCACSWG